MRRVSAPDEILESVTASGMLAWLFKWQQVLGPTLGMVTREELARAVEAAFRDGFQTGNCQLPDEDPGTYWLNSNARKALGR